MIRRPPRSTRTDTLFPYTTLFRSQGLCLQRPLRQARRALKDLQADEPAAPALYEEIKALELRLEQVAQVWALGACRASPAFRDPESPGRDAEIAAAAPHLSACLGLIAPGDPDALHQIRRAYCSERVGQ